MRRTLGVLVGALAGSLAACSLIPGRSAAPAPIRVSVDAAPRLNPDEQGESLPTSVRVYQLTTAAKAGSLDLLDLVRDPKAALGPDLLAVDELLVEPGRRAEKTFARDKGTRAVIVAALVRRPAGTSWREVVELPSPGRAADLSFALREYRLERR